MTGPDFDPSRYDFNDPLFRPMTIAAAAERVGRSERTVKRWIQERRLTAFEVQSPREIVLVEKDVVEVDKANRDAFAAGRPRRKGGSPDTPDEAT